MSKKPVPEAREDLEKALRACQERFLALTGLSSDWYWEQDELFRFTFFSGLLHEKTGLAAKAHLGKMRWDTPRLNLTEEDWERHRKQLERHEPFSDFEMHRRDADGNDHWTSVSGVPVFDESGRFTGYRGIGRDITEKKLADGALRESEARFRALTNLSADWYWEQDEELRFVARAGGKTEGEGMRPHADIGKRRWELPTITGVTDEQWRAHRELLTARKPFRDLEYEREYPDGKRFVSVSGEPIFDVKGQFRGYRGIGRDISERKRADEKIQFLAYHDGLTKLPNRAHFSQMLNHALLHSRRYNRRFAVLFLDLDRFKNINDTLGHEAGDVLLCEMARRLKESLRGSDVVARLGGDEFVVLIEEVTEPKYVATVARKILSTVIKPVTLQGQDYRVTASVGVCLYPDDAKDEQSLMKNADIAMYRAKEEGKNGYKFYSESINVHSFERLALETSLRRAMERGEFFLHYQAKLDLKSDRITGVEALLRWQHPDLGLVSPAQFIPIAEETGLIVPIGLWVLRTACAQNVAWQRAGLPPVCMAVNLSPRQFNDDGLLEEIAKALRDSGMNPQLLELELTEGMVMQNAERAGKVLASIKKLGVRIAIDDFGVGYSSLANLKRFPIDILKVDRSFIRDLSSDTEDQAITEAIIAMGRTLSLTVVAEGVETKEQQTFLRDHSCDEMQGYYFSKPVIAAEFAALLTKQD